MKKLLLGSFAFLIILTGCASVGGYEKTIAGIAETMTTEITNGFHVTIDSDIAGKTGSADITVIGTDVEATINLNGTDYTFTDKAGTITTDLPDAISSSVQQSGTASVLLTTLATKELGFISKSVTQNYSTNGTGTVDGFNYIDYVLEDPITGTESGSDQIGFSEDELTLYDKVINENGSSYTVTLTTNV